MNFVDYTALSSAEAEGGRTSGARWIMQLSRIRYQLGAGILLGVFLPILIRNNFERFPDTIANYDNSFYGTLAALLIGFMIFRKVSALPGTRSYTNVLPAFLTSYGIIMALFFTLRLQYSRTQFAASFILVVITFYVIAYILARYRRAQFVLVTDKSELEFGKTRGVDWIVAPDRSVAQAYRHLPLAVDFHSDMLDDEWERYLAEEAISGRLVYDRRQVMESLMGRVTIQHLSENSFGHLAPDSIYAPAKRYIDLVVASVALLLLWPIMLVVGVLIRLDSKGPAIFRQERMGYRGRPFTVFKFRTMRVAGDPREKVRADMTMSDDDRITRIGRFLRRSRLDELPQLINILKGEMSLIGPRPETLTLSRWYEEQIPFYRYRHIVRPGITGWAQVNQGHVTSVDAVREKLEYDFYYVKQFSLWTDILIVIKTVGVMLTGHGSK